MKQKIKKLCQKLEQKHDIQIIFAVENGSRAWRMESKDSDYDVRFVYKHKIEGYVQLRQPRDVINAAFDKNLKPCNTKGAELDLSGFDMIKFLRLLSNSNPTTIEWLTSNIVYYGRQPAALVRYAKENFNPLALYHHYKSMCRNNYLKYLKSGTMVTYKKYLYAYRGLINAKWVAHKNCLPPINFNNTIKGMKEFVPERILNILKEIIKLKSSGKEKDIIQNIVKMDKYIELFLDDQKEEPKPRNKKNIELLDKELRSIII